MGGCTAATLSFTDKKFEKRSENVANRWISVAGQLSPWCGKAGVACPLSHSKDVFFQASRYYWEGITIAFSLLTVWM